MLYWLTALSDGGDFFNLFRYITFRAGGAFLTALVFGFLFGRPLIAVLRKKQGKGQPIRDDGPEGHFSKAGTPTMGGLLIVGALATSTLLWARWDNPFTWIVLGVTLAFALIGVSFLIIVEAALAFLGVSDVNQPSWGVMITLGRDNLDDAPHAVFFPAIFMFLTVLSINYIGDRLRQFFDVREAAI